MYRPIILSAAAFLLALSPAVWSQTPTADSDQSGRGIMADPSKEPALENDAMPADEQEVRAFLESQGYSEIENVEMDGEIITADATRDGQRYRVEIRRMSESQDGG
jgi:hypothetical protein